MNSKKCSQCGFVSWAGAEFCKNCGRPLIERSAGDQTRQDGNNQSSARGAFPGELKKGLANWSLGLGIVSCLTLGLLGIGSTVGMALAIIAIVKINRYPFEYGGKGIAIAGLITNILSMAIVAPVGLILAIAIPNLLAARTAANEGATIQRLRTITVAESRYEAVHGIYGTLDQLEAEALINPDLVAGSRHGYRFTIVISPGGSDGLSGFEAVGVPVEYPSTGRRSFFVDETGVIRVADSHGADATKSDPPLNVGNYSPGPPTSMSYDRGGSN